MVDDEAYQQPALCRGLVPIAPPPPLPPTATAPPALAPPTLAPPTLAPPTVAPLPPGSTPTVPALAPAESVPPVALGAPPAGDPPADAASAPPLGLLFPPEAPPPTDGIVPPLPDPEPHPKNTPTTKPAARPVVSFTAARRFGHIARPSTAEWERKSRSGSRSAELTDQCIRSRRAHTGAAAESSMMSTRGAWLRMAADDVE
jgi:Wiskott-Aldrich syndrome protein